MKLLVSAHFTHMYIAWKDKYICQFVFFSFISCHKSYISQTYLFKQVQQTFSYSEIETHFIRLSHPCVTVFSCLMIDKPYVVDNQFHVFEILSVVLIVSDHLPVG